MSDVTPSIVVKSDKDTHFTGPLAQNVAELEALDSGFRGPRGVLMIESISLISDQNLDWDLEFYATADGEQANMDSDFFIGRCKFVQADGRQDTNSLWKYTTTEASYPFRALKYVCNDAVNKIYVALRNRNATGKNAGATGEVVVNMVVTPIQ